VRAERSSNGVSPSWLPLAYAQSRQAARGFATQRLSIAYDPRRSLCGIEIPCQAPRSIGAMGHNGCGRNIARRPCLLKPSNRSLSRCSRGVRSAKLPGQVPTSDSLRGIFAPEWHRTGGFARAFRSRWARSSMRIGMRGAGATYGDVVNVVGSTSTHHISMSDEHRASFPDVSAALCPLRAPRKTGVSLTNPHTGDSLKLLRRRLTAIVAASSEG